MFSLSLVARALQWRRICLLFSLFATIDALRPSIGIVDDPNSPSLSLPVAQRGNLTDSTIVLFGGASTHNESDNASTTGTASRPLNATLFEQITVGAPNYKCDGAAYGRNLNLRSCLAALGQIASYDRPQTFGQREKGTWDVNLPFRFLGGESELRLPLLRTTWNELWSNR